MLQVSGNTLRHEQQFKYLWIKKVQFCVSFIALRHEEQLNYLGIKQAKFCVSFIALWSHNGIFQASQNCQSTQIGLRSDLHLLRIMNYGLKEYYILTNAGSKNGIFMKRS